MPGALAVNERVTVASAAASVGPAAKSIPGISNRSVWPAGSALVTVTVTVSPSVTLRTGPGRLAVAVAQLPGVDGTPKPQIGIETAGAVTGSGCSVPGRAHRLMATGAAEAGAPARPRPAATRATTSSARVFVRAGLRIAGPSFRSCPFTARRRRSS